MKKMKLKNFLLGVASLAVIMAFYSFTTKTISNYGDDYQPKWENLKVLPQDISKDSLMGIMKGYNAALGVKCAHCHTPKKDDPSKMDFADDSKMAKNVARGMIQMTHEINDNYFKPYYPDPKPHAVTDVSCVLCHRGVAKPNDYLKNISTLFPPVEPEN